MKLGFTGIIIVGAILLVTATQAQLLPPRGPNPDRGGQQSRDLASQSVNAYLEGKPEQALELAERAIAASGDNPWAHYDRAVALGHLGRTEEAVTEYQSAADLFSKVDVWGHSVSIWGKAHLLAQVGRCKEAQIAFNEYSDFVKAFDADAAALGKKYAADCINSAEPKP